MATLTGEELKDAIGNLFTITPLLDHTQIGIGSIDVRLGSIFIAPERSKLLSVDSHLPPTSYQQIQRKVYVRFGGEFVLHSKAFALTATLEYVKLSHGVAARVKGRSSPGRAGLIIATADAIHPGFAGCPTLELFNAGDLPVILHPGDRIAQIVFSTSSESETKEDGLRHSRYQIDIEPGFTRWGEDVERDRLLKILYPS